MFYHFYFVVCFLKGKFEKVLFTLNYLFWFELKKNGMLVCNKTDGDKAQTAIIMAF